MDVYFHYQPREIICRSHGRNQENIPWAATFSQVTYRFEVLALQYCQSMAQKHAARYLNISPSTLSGVIHRIIGRVREYHSIRALRTVGIDEISYHKGKYYATVVYDLDRGCVVWVGQGKGRETIDEFFSTCLSPFQMKNVRFASCDMSKAYIGAIKHWCPKAKLVLDRFHIVKALNNAVDEVRKIEWRTMKQTAEGRALKGLRWLLFKHSSKRDAVQNQTLTALRTSNRHIWRAWVLKDEFEQFWGMDNIDSAREFVQRWTSSAMRSRLQSIKHFVKTLRDHIEDILSFIETRLTNAVGEGINRIIRIVKNRASGFANLESFADMIYLTVGDVDIPAQIPVCFHAY
jgi:transposase